MKKFIKNIEQKTVTQKAQIIKLLRKDGLLNKPFSIILSPKTSDIYYYTIANDSFKFNGKIFNTNIEEELIKNNDILNILTKKVNEYNIEEFIRIFSMPDVVKGDLFLWYLLLYFFEIKPEISLKVIQSEKIKESDLYEMLKKYDRKVNPQLLEGINVEIKKITITEPQLIEDIIGINRIWSSDWNFVFNNGENIFFCILETISILDLQENKEERLKLLREKIEYFVKRGVNINKKNNQGIGLVEHFLMRKEGYFTFADAVKLTIINIIDILVDNGYRLSREEIHKLSDAHRTANPEAISLEFNTALNQLENKSVSLYLNNSNLEQEENL
mgnify:CR=1 FL=1